MSALVCSVCGENHDLDESPECDGCEAIEYSEWVFRLVARCSLLESLISEASRTLSAAGCPPPESSR